MRIKDIELNSKYSKRNHSSKVFHFLNTKPFHQRLKKPVTYRCLSVVLGCGFNYHVNHSKDVKHQRLTETSAQPDDEVFGNKNIIEI
jgi:hypothetical protein